MEILSYCLRISGSLPPDVFANAPWLVLLAGRTDPVAEWIFNECSGRYWGVWGHTRASAQSLNHHLRSLNLVMLADGSQVFFRWYDPRVLADVLPLLEPGQLARLYGPVKSIGIPTEDGKVTLHSAPPSNTRERLSGPLLTFTARQFAALDLQAQYRFRHRLARELTESYPEMLGALPAEAIRTMVETGLKRAARHGLTWESSLLGFLHLMVEIAPNFDEHPRIAELLSQPGLPPDHRFKLLYTSISSEEWAAIRSHSDFSAWFLQDMKFQ